MMTKARLAVRQALKSLNPGDRVLVAVSGGADSLLLAHCLKLEGSEQALNISAVIIDHQLQEQSGDIALKTKMKLLEMGIPEVHVIKVEIVKKDGLEADARTARYEALTEFASKEQVSAIFLGHNQDDLAESVLLGLTQGAGTKSLAGMTKQRDLYFRPFLSLSREEIVAACSEAHIEYWSDPHNDDERFTRVKDSQTSFATHGITTWTWHQRGSRAFCTHLQRRFRCARYSHRGDFRHHRRSRFD